MTRSEQFYVKRLQKRNEDLFVALCIIKTWLSFPDEDAPERTHEKKKAYADAAFMSIGIKKSNTNKELENKEGSAKWTGQNMLKR